MASDSIVDERTLREIYLTGFEIAVKEGHPRSIMSSYNLVNGTYANENKHLLMEILRVVVASAPVGDDRTVMRLPAAPPRKALCC